EVSHASLLIPKKRVATLIPSQVRRAGDLTAVVERKRFTECATQGAEVHHPAVFPKERVHGGSSRRRIHCCVGEGPPPNLSTVVDEESSAVGATESAQVLQRPGLRPAKRMHLGCSRDEENASVRVGNRVQSRS